MEPENEDRSVSKINWRVLQQTCEFRSKRSTTKSKLGLTAGVRVNRDGELLAESKGPIGVKKLKVVILPAAPVLGSGTVVSRVNWPVIVLLPLMLLERVPAKVKPSGFARAVFADSTAIRPSHRVSAYFVVFMIRPQKRPTRPRGRLDPQRLY